MNEAADSHEGLAGEWNELQLAWQNTQSVWKDDVAFEYEKRFMSPFCEEIPSFLKELENLRDELQRIRRSIE